MFRRIAIPLVAGIAVVLWLALAGTPVFAQHGHGVSHHGHHSTAHYGYYGAGQPHYWHGSYSYPSYRYTPYYGYRAYGYGGAYAYPPYAYRSWGYGPRVRGGCW